MNLIVYTGAAQRNEAFMLSSLRENFISPINGSPSVGEIEDSIIGLYNLTKTGVYVDHYHLMLLLSGVKQLPDTSKWGFVGPNGVKYYTGREIVSMILVQTPISMVRKPQSYDPNLAPYIDYHPDDIKVVIDDGVLKSGVLDKKAIARGQNGGIFHLIALEYGFEAAINAIYNLQQIAVAYNMMSGVTIGMQDIVVDKETKRKIDRIANDIVSRSQLVTDKLISGELIPPIGQTVSDFYESQQISLLSVYDDFKDPVLRAKCMNVHINGLLMMALCGSKGELENIYNMVSSIGQKVINGERMLEKFGYKRTLAYYRRFETDPEARGYIPDSYVSGTGTGAFVSGAMNARFDLVVKALNTSVTGEQNRNSIKNMEGSVVDNYRRTTKSHNLQQFVYGEDGLNPSRLEPVKLATIMLDNAALEAKFKLDDATNDKVFVREFEAIVAERNEYRRMFLQLEQINVRNLITDEVKLPVNIERIIDRVKRAFAGEPAMKAVELKQASEYIWNYLEDLHYVLINEYQRSIKGKVPDVIKFAPWLLRVYIRPYLAAPRIKDLPVKAIEAICERITLRYTNALMAPGSAAGILAAQSFSAPLTQYMLDAHRRSATGGTSKSSMRTAKEVLGAKPVDKLEAPTMIVPLLPKYAADQNLAQEIANGIENMALNYFVTSWQVFFEKYGEPKHPKYAPEAAMIAEFNKFNPLLKPPSDLIRWCIRLQLNRVNMILKSMSVEVIVRKLRTVYPDLYIVYSPENAPTPIIRIYMRNILFSSSINTDTVNALRETVMATTIRGVQGVISAHTNDRTKIYRNVVDDATGAIVRTEQHAIMTNGTNIYGMMCVEQIDAYQVQSDAVMEIYEMFGVEAARHKIMIELRGLVDGISHRHYMSYADEMTYNGYVTSVERQGLSHREPNSIMLRIGFAAPIGTLEQAAVHNLSDNISGITAPLLIGSVPKIGTLYNRMYVNDKFVKANLKSADDILDAL
ncbi:DNA-directed RNA polymerase subunit A'' [Faustovirus]|nr:DNA-directed RNA polymerase subunit A'' [Faustovirus]AMN84762.1 DNA-directed RNA polymerase subunit A'' [Faustovirus]AMP44106.1 DNA-directed RNA polymerase subunit A'' [Faustovirus]